MKDFFSRYRDSHSSHYIVPGIFGLLFGFAIVAEMTGTPIELGAIRANVLEANTVQKIYDADLFLESSGSGLVLRMGKNADSVDTLRATLLADPSVLLGLSSENKVTNIESIDAGVYHITTNLGGRMIRAGDIATYVIPTLSGEANIALLDASFTSSGVEYMLTTKN